MLGKIEIKTETVRAEAGHATGAVRELEYAFYRVTSLLSRMGFPKEVQQVIQTVQKLILIVRMLHTTLIFLERGTTYGLFLGLVTLIGAGITATTLNEQISEAIVGT